MQRKSSKPPLEKELKYHLDQKSYAKLVKACGKSILNKDQLVTYYFDNETLGLRRKRFGFRVRTDGGKDAKVTLKFPAKTPPGGPKGFKVRHEYEASIPLATAKEMIKGKIAIADVEASPVQELKRHFSPAFISQLSLLGSMKTMRTVAKLASRFKMEIDRCDYFGKRFYELELETDRPGPASEAVKDLLAKHEIPYKPLMNSKLSRFLDEWEKRKRGKKKKRVAPR